MTKYIMYLNGAFVLNPDKTVYQYDDLELALVLTQLLKEGKIEQATIYKHDGVIECKSQT